MNSESDRPSGSFFDSLGLYTGSVSPLMVQLAKEFRPKDFISLLKDHRLPDHYFFDDEQAYNYVQNCEQWSDLVNEIILRDPMCRPLAEKIEENLDHGINHITRVEAWDKYIFEHDKNLRLDNNYLFFQFSKNLAIRFHDYVLLDTGIKDEHDHMAALYSFAFIQAHYEEVFGLLKSKENPDPISNDEAQKLIWGVALIIYYHSKPEDIPDIHELQKNGILNMDKLYQNMMDYSLMRGTTIYGYFKPFQPLQKILENIKSGAFITPEFSRDELQGLIKQAKLMSAADKLDSSYPELLAATRTLLTKPDRAIYLRVEDEVSIDQEFYIRIEDGAGYNSSCDFNRILFELTRTKTFEDISPIVSFLFRKGLEKRGVFFLDAFPKLLAGDFSGYLDGYQKHLQSMIYTLLIKAGFSEDQARSDSTMRNIIRQEEIIETKLKNTGFNPESGIHIIDILRGEINSIKSILKLKYELLKQTGLNEMDLDRVKILLNMAVMYQQRSLRKSPGPVNPGLPYDNYYKIELIKK